VAAVGPLWRDSRTGEGSRIKDRDVQLTSYFFDETAKRHRFVTRASLFRKQTNFPAACSTAMFIRFSEKAICF
jgi:hypothetical protein